MIGNRIKEARLHANFNSVQDLANKIEKITQRTLSSYENNETEPKISTVVAIAKICNVSFVWLSTGEGEMTAKDSNKKLENNIIKLNFYKDFYKSEPKITYMDEETLKDTYGVLNFGNLDFVKIETDRFNPFLIKNESIIVERISEPKDGELVVVVIEEEYYIKKYFKVPFQKWFRLETPNNKNEVIDIDTKERIKATNIVGIIRK